MQTEIKKIGIIGITLFLLSCREESNKKYNLASFQDTPMEMNKYTYLSDSFVGIVCSFKDSTLTICDDNNLFHFTIKNQDELTLDKTFIDIINEKLILFHFTNGALQTNLVDEYYFEKKNNRWELTYKAFGEFDLKESKINFISIQVRRDAINSDQNVNLSADTSNWKEISFENKLFCEYEKLSTDPMVLFILHNALNCYSPLLVNNIGFEFQKVGNHAMAIYSFYKVLELDSNRTVAYLNLADSYWSIGKVDSAKKYYEVYGKLFRKNKFEDMKFPKRVNERIISITSETE